MQQTRLDVTEANKVEKKLLLTHYRCQAFVVVCECMYLQWIFDNGVIVRVVGPCKNKSGGRFTCETCQVGPRRRRPEKRQLEAAKSGKHNAKFAWMFVQGKRESARHVLLLLFTSILYEYYPGADSHRIGPAATTTASSNIDDYAPGNFVFHRYRYRSARST